jgi:hypothetical protein
MLSHTLTIMVILIRSRDVLIIDWVGRANAGDVRLFPNIKFIQFRWLEILAPTTISALGVD